MKPPSTPPAATLTGAKIITLTGITTGVFAEAAKSGALKRLKGGVYDSTATLAGLVRYLHERQNSLPVYDSVAQCSAATGIPEGVIKMVRRKSKEGFAGQRVHLGPVLRSIFAVGEGEMESDWKGLKMKYEALLTEIELKEAQDETLDKDATGSAIKRCMALLFATLDRGAEIELPPALKGLDEAAARDVLVGYILKMKAAMRDGLGELIKEGEASESSPK
jgi:hypothetical protein